MKLPEGVNGYREMVMFARRDETGRRCLNALRRAMREEKVFEHAFGTIGDLVVRLSYAARDGMTLDFTDCEENMEQFIHKLGDIYERWQRILEAGE